MPRWRREAGGQSVPISSIIVFSSQQLSQLYISIGRCYIASILDVDASWMLLLASLSYFNLAGRGDIPLLYLVYLIVYTQLGIVFCGACAVTSCCLLVGYQLQVLQLARGSNKTKASWYHFFVNVRCGVLRAGSKNNIKTSSYSVEKHQKLPYNFFWYRHYFFLTLFKLTTCEKPPALTTCPICAFFSLAWLDCSRLTA